MRVVSQLIGNEAVRQGLLAAVKRSPGCPCRPTLAPGIEPLAQALVEGKASTGEGAEEIYHGTTAPIPMNPVEKWH